MTVVLLRDFCLKPGEPIGDSRQSLAMQGEEDDNEQRQPQSEKEPLVCVEPLPNNYLNWFSCLR